VAARIKAVEGDISTLTATQFESQVGGEAAVLNAILVGIALLSLVVGGLSVVNTMVMSVAERRREIGVRRAIGATRERVVYELLLESGWVGFIGGIVGLGLAAVTVVLANEAGRADGTVLFDLRVTGGVFAVLFSTGLGILGGLLPAWNAARLDPVDALRFA
jgi:putative ABC transport system permease protein